MLPISLRDIIYHAPSETFGRVSHIDKRLGVLSFATTPYRAVPKQTKVCIEECAYVGAEWKQAWCELAKYGLNDPRIQGYIPPKPPVVMIIGAYKATVEYRSNFVHLACEFAGEYEPLNNTFTDPDHALALGQALVTACRPAGKPTGYSDWDYNTSDDAKLGWLLLKAQMLPLLPDTLTMKSAYEMGYALVWLGEVMQMARHILHWLGTNEVFERKAG